MKVIKLEIPDTNIKRSKANSLGVNLSPLKKIASAQSFGKKIEDKINSKIKKKIKHPDVIYRIFIPVIDIT
ncbi:hypothetical protein VXQ92_01430 [Acinetobacter sp. 228]|uniref:hypothetical protein n=1 Tax=Acinetobacter sp. 228 TaxID=3114700 RepID=UPI003A89EC60